MQGCKVFGHSKGAKLREVYSRIVKGPNQIREAREVREAREARDHVTAI